MNSLKTLFVMAMLGAVAYGVYVSINNNPAPSNPQQWQTPTVELPGAGSTTPPFSAKPTGTAAIAPGQPVNLSASQNTPPAVDVSVPSAVNTGALNSPLSARAGPGKTSPGNTNTAKPGSAPPTTGSTIGMPPPSYPSARRRAPSAEQARVVPPPPAGIGQTPPVGLGNPPLRADTSANAQLTVPRTTQPAVPRPRGSFSAFMLDARQRLNQGRLAEVLSELTAWRNAPQLSPDQARQVQGLLSQLAGTVVYSRQHLLEPAYTVQPGDTLDQISQRYNVPTQLLAKINGIRNPQDLEPGRKLKVVRGPFNVEVNLDKYELVLTLQGCYAGRFPIGIGRDRQTLAGSYSVREKSTRPPQSAAGHVGERGNALGARWIGLGNQIGIHGTNNPQHIGRPGGNGWISLADRDIEDVYNILSIGSRVVIRR